MTDRAIYANNISRLSAIKCQANFAGNKAMKMEFMRCFAQRTAFQAGKPFLGCSQELKTTKFVGTVGIEKY